MTANELLDKQLDDSGYQLEKVLEGIGPDSLEFRIAPTAMTVPEIVEHLCEAYTALESESRGASHAWGSFAIEDKSWNNLQAELNSARSKALAVATGATDEGAIMAASAFMVAHDYYHVGQLVAIRVATDPEWDSYSIYRHG